MAVIQVPKVQKPTLVHLAHSSSQQVLWALEELGCVDYDLKPIARPTDTLPEGLSETHVQGHSPQLILPSGEVLTQAAAIVKYLLLTYDTENRFHDPNMGVASQVRELYLLNLLGFDLIPRLGDKMIFIMLELKTPFFIRPLISAIKRKLFSVWLDAEVENALKVLEGELEGREWLMGTREPGVVDFLGGYTVELAVRNRLMELERFPRVKGFWERCQAREGWKRAIEKGNGFDLDFVKRING